MTSTTGATETTGATGEAVKSGTEAPAGAPEAANTRERILDVALDLFIEHGYDKTSLREIAEQLGVTKAALYYHFASKEDILMALHMRLHEIGLDPLARLTDQAPTAAMWGELLEQLVDQMLANRRILILHERNQAAFEAMHRKDHEARHDDLQERLRTVLNDSRLPVRDRVRMAASFGALMGGIMLSGDVFSDVPSEELGEHLRGVVRDLMA